MIANPSLFLSSALRSEGQGLLPLGINELPLIHNLSVERCLLQHGAGLIIALIYTTSHCRGERSDTFKE